MSSSKIEDLDIEIDIEECVPTVRINPDEYRAKVEEQEYVAFWHDSCWSDEPITKRYANPEEGKRAPV